MRLLAVALAVGISLFPLQLARANNYDELKAAAMQRCAAIDAAAYQSGLLFNPDGYRSFYLRSQCFQQASMSLDVGVGGPSGRWSDAFIETVFPVQERAQAVTKNIRFSAAPIISNGTFSGQRLAAAQPTRG